jgi:hypothetical protein
MCDDECIHYRLIDGAAVEVEPGEAFDYCTNDPEGD